MSAADEIAKGRDRIAKLMNMTVENGCTEDEQATAMAMAAGIAAKLGIEADSVRPVGEAKRKLATKYKQEELKIHQALAGEAAAALYGVEFNAPNFGKNGFWFIGRDENIALAEMTMLWLSRQVELLYKQYLPKGLTQKARAEFRSTFKEACALRTRDRAYKLIREMKTDNSVASAATGSNALVVAGHFETLQAELDDYWAERLKIGKYALAKTPEQIEADRVRAEEARQLEADYASGKKKRPKVKEYKTRAGRSLRTGNGTEAGFVAGDRVQLRKEVK